MAFTISEKKWVLETVKYDIYTTSYAVLKENGLPVSNMDIKISNENLLRNYFNAGLIKEGVGSTILNLFKKFYDLLKAAFALVGLVGIGGFVYQKVKDYIAKDKASVETVTKNAKEIIKEPTNNFEINADDPEAYLVKGSKMDDVIKAQNATSATSAASGAVQSGGAAETIWQKVSGKVSGFVSHINSIIVSALQKIGISQELASSIAPVAMVVGSLAAAYVIYKLLKLLIAGVKKLFGTKKSKGEVPTNEAVTMASMSIKMQKQAVSKIKNKNLKAKAMKAVAKKEASFKRGAAKAKAKKA